jgi:hypothetical protein
MSLEGSINHFYIKYKKPLAILVLVFFMYQIFDYYNNVYEGLTNEQLIKAASAAELRRKATYARQQADQTRRQAESKQNQLEGMLDQKSSAAMKLRNEVNDQFNTASTMSSSACVLGTRADEAEAAARAMQWEGL